MTKMFYAELLIKEVESRPILWDSRIHNYNNKIERRRAWDEICRKLYSDYDSKSAAEKNETAALLQKKWKNIRDAYARQLNKINLAKTNSIGEKWKQYVYFDILYFLSPLFPSTSDNSDKKTHRKKYNKRKSVDLEEGSSKCKSLKSLDEDKLVFQMLAENLKPKKEMKPEDGDDSDKHFLLSLLPDFRSIPQSYKLEAKFEMISVLRKYNAAIGYFENHNSSGDSD